MRSDLAVRLLVAAVVLAGLGLVGAGLLDLAFFERTPEAVRAEQRGHVLLSLGCAALLATAGLVVLRIGPRWAGILIALPAVVCGGLVMVAGESFFPQLSALIAFPVAVAGVVGVLVRRHERAV